GGGTLSMSDARLPREAFMILAAVGWADGALESSEADAIAAAAEDAGMADADVSALRQRISSRVEPDDVDTSALPTAERLYLYALAYWVAAANGTEGVQVQ